MLNLCAPSDPTWLEAALEQLDVVLVDHAHCEKKAAGAAVKLLFAYPHHGFLQAPISQLAREELAHFERTLELLERKGIAYRSMRPSPYAARLHALLRHREPDRCLDVLLVAGLIEARSCERMKLLADAVADPEIADFYRDLLACEARHHGLYVQLAEQLTDPASARGRLEELAIHEAKLLADPAPFVRLHS
jgi:tRNA-(ms[2]io[6]A)-hydroxylase